MVFKWTFIKYPIKIKSVLGTCTMNFLIPPMDETIMGRHKYMRGEDDYQALKDFSKKDLIIAH